jgi:hypothetical protein
MKYIWSCKYHASKVDVHAHACGICVHSLRAMLLWSVVGLRTRSLTRPVTDWEGYIYKSVKNTLRLLQLGT